MAFPPGMREAMEEMMTDLQDLSVQVNTFMAQAADDKEEVVRAQVEELHYHSRRHDPDVSACRLGSS